MITITMQLTPIRVKTTVLDINTTQGDKVLTASWTPDTVEFILSIKASDLGLTSEELANEVDLSQGTLVGDTFTYNEHLYIAYHARYTDDDQLILPKYALNNYDVLEVTLDNETLNPENYFISLNNETIDKEIMQYYKDNGNKPLSIKITSLQKKIELWFYKRQFLLISII